MPRCHCIVVDHPSGPVWVTAAVDRLCPEHRHGQAWVAA